MLRRVTGSASCGVATTAAATTAVAAHASAARSFHDHERWYGHALLLDNSNYRYTGEVPAWQRREARTEIDRQAVKAALPALDFATSWEMLLFDADRLHPHLGRKEFSNEIKFRLEKQANTVARAQQLIRDGTYAKDPAVEDTMIARIADEEHCQAEMKYVKCIRANEVAEDNRLDILPGGSPMSLREKTRWNNMFELHPVDRAEINARLMAWLPEKYHVVYFDDFQTAAANDAGVRAEMKAVVSSVAKEHADEAKALGYEQDLKEVVRELEDDVDPSAAITPEAIAKSTSLDELEDWSRVVHEYNGDKRLLLIYERAAQLQKNDAHLKLVQKLKQWTSTIKTWA
jgi:hypothetical protein